MPSPPTHSAAHALRTSHRRLWRAATVGAGAVLGVLPLIYVLPMPTGQRAALGGLALLYLAGKGYRLRRARETVQQLRLETCFIGHSFDGHQLRSCLQRRGHLWTHSYTVRALRRLMARPLPNLLITGKKCRCVHTAYRHALGGMRPPRIRAGLPLAVLLTGGVFAGASGGVGAAWPLRVGMASALVLLGAEGVLALCRLRARRFFAHLTEALADWTRARSVHELLRRRRASTSYRHTRLYRAPPWFRPPTPSEASAPSRECHAV